MGVFGRDSSGKRKYKLFNRAVGVLGCVTLEMYRLAVAPYEDEKRRENGDAYEGL